MNLNQAIITTRFVVYEHSEIVTVFHDEEDDWTFFGKEDITTEDALVLSLGEIIKLDNSIDYILNMGKGYTAHRNSKKDNWRIQKYE